MSGPKRTLTDEEHQRIGDLTAGGWSLREIAEHLNVNERTVSRHRVKLGLAAPRTAYDDVDWDLAARLVAEGCPAAEVARTIGAHPKYVCARFPGAFSRANADLFRKACRELEEAGMPL